MALLRIPVARLPEPNNRRRFIYNYKTMPSTESRREGEIVDGGQQNLEASRNTMETRSSLFLPNT